MLTHNDVAIIDSLLQKRISDNNSELERKLEEKISKSNSELEKRFEQRVSESNSELEKRFKKSMSENNIVLEDRFEKRMRTGFTEFFETVLEPYLENERIENKKEHEKTREQIQLLTEHIKDHEKRIRKLEVKCGL